MKKPAVEVYHLDRDANSDNPAAGAAAAASEVYSVSQHFKKA